MEWWQGDAHARSLYGVGKVCMLCTPSAAKDDNLGIRTSVAHPVR